MGLLSSWENLGGTAWARRRGWQPLVSHLAPPTTDPPSDTGAGVWAAGVPGFLACWAWIEPMSCEQRSRELLAALPD